MSKVSNYPILNTDNNQFLYYVSTQNTIVISKYIGNETNIIIPETIEDLPVTKIDHEAFKNNLTLQSILMPSVKIISNNAFDNCINLVTVSATNLTHIIDSVFANCSSLVNVDFPNLIYLRYDSFANCPLLENINLPKISYIPDRTFSHCSNLKNVNTPKVHDIGPYAFQYCTSLEYINIENISNINAPNISYIDNFAFYYSGIKSINLPLLDALGNEAFSHCNLLYSLILPKNLNIFGTDVFAYSYVKSLTIDYGRENICNVTINDWTTFASKLTGIDGVNISLKSVKNYLYTKNLVTVPNLLRCTQIVASVNSTSSMRWAVELLDGNIIYISTTLYKWETMHLQLSRLNIPYGTQFRLKAIVNGKSDYYCHEIFEYAPFCYTVFYEYLNEGPLYQSKIDSALSPPVLKCSSVYVKHNANAMVKYELRLRITNETIYESGRKTSGDSWTLSLSTLKLTSGNQLILHAGVIGGNDSEPFVILQYDPNASTDSDTALFSYVGNALYTSVFYKGTT